MQGQASIGTIWSDVQLVLKDLWQVAMTARCINEVQQVSKVNVDL